MSYLTALRSRRYADAHPFEVRTEDGVQLAGSRIGPAGPALVFCHGFLGWHGKGRIVTFLERMAARFRVYAVDLRGHGRSGGLSTFGDREFLDVDAAVRMARQETDAPVVTMGVSMGGIAVIRHAAFRGGVDAVVTISTPARWDGHVSKAVRQLRWLASTERGRRFAEVLGVRVTRDWSWPEDPEAVVARIAPTPLLVVHGRDDHFFDEEEAWRLYRSARDPKRLMLSARFGHAEDGLSPAFADLVARRVLETLEREPAPR